MPNFKNMKIAINEQQPLDEVVKELERLGYKQDRVQFSEPVMIFCYLDGFYIKWDRDIEPKCQYTTLTELKNMEQQQ